MTAPRGFRLVPDDVLFFRDGKPSMIGSDHYLRSLFPPHPSTLYGALRTRRLVDFGVSLRGLGEERWAGLDAELGAEVGEWGGFGSLRLRGPWLVKEEVLLPAPHDLAVKRADRKVDETGQPKPPRAERVYRYHPAHLLGGCSHPLRPLAPSDPKKAEDAESAAGWYLTPEGFAAWSAGGSPKPGDLVHRDSLWVDERRTGVGLEDDKRTSRKGRLFTFGYIRLRQGVTLGFDVTGSDLEPSGWVRLGGERKTARLEPGPTLPEPSPEVGSGSLLSLTLVTPAVSEHGAYPPGFGPDRLEDTLGGHRVRLVAAAVGGSLPLGGWDMARGRPKPMRRALPPGSVFYFEPTDDSTDLDELAAALHGTTLSDDPHLKLQGFGLVLAGRGFFRDERDG